MQGKEGRAMGNKTHYAGCDRAHEGDNMDYWSEKTACGLYAESDTIAVSDRECYVDCKKCLRVIEKSKTLPQ